MQMHCECGHKWCYVCVVDLGKDADINGETSHRIESTGCPMYVEADVVAYPSMMETWMCGTLMMIPELWDT